MMQFSSKGQFGKGLYFAEEPGYSHFYATRGTSVDNDLAPAEREFMLADVLMSEALQQLESLWITNSEIGNEGAAEVADSAASATSTWSAW